MTDKATNIALAVAASLAFAAAVGLALLALLFAASSVVAAQPPRIVIDCGTLRGSGSVIVENAPPGTRYRSTFRCPQPEPQKDLPA